MSDLTVSILLVNKLIHMFKFCWRPPSNTIAFMSHSLVTAGSLHGPVLYLLLPYPTCPVCPQRAAFQALLQPSGLRLLPGPSLLLLTPTGIAPASCCCCSLRIWKVPTTGHRSPAAAFPALLPPPDPAVVLHPSSQWRQSYPGSVNNKPPWSWGLLTVLLPFSFFFFF